MVIAHGNCVSWVCKNINYNIAENVIAYFVYYDKHA